MGKYLLSVALSSLPFHVTLWVLLTMGIIGNILVVLWRLSQKRDHRSSTLSMLIIFLAVSDFLYCLHLLLLEGVVAKAFSANTPAHILPESSTATICGVSGSLSILSCSLALWITLDIAIYAVLSIGETNCCCSLGTKGQLCTTILCQCLFTTIPILIISISYPLNDMFHSPYYKSWEAFYDDNRENTTIRSRDVQISDFISTCAFVQSTGVHFLANYTFVDDLDVRCRGNIDYSIQILGGCLLSINTFLVLACTVLYLQVCRKMRARNLQTSQPWRSDEQRPQRRLSVIVLVNTVCWLPATVIHWWSFLEIFIGDGNCIFFSTSAAVNMLLISISPAVNPLIYTLAGRNFLQSIRSCFRRLKCHVSLRCSRDNRRDDPYPITGVDRCTCIPCIKCVRRWEDFDTVSWPSEETKLLSSDDYISASN